MNLPRQKITTGLRNGWRKVNERLAPLAGDRRGSTLALMAAGLIPVIAALGAGIDAGRLYLVKSQLQAGVDAAALASARAFAVTDGSPAARDKQASAYFYGNFASDYMGVSNLQLTPDFKTVGGINVTTITARAIVPMTFMRIFGFQPRTMQAVAKAELQPRPLEVMVVLDDTGSMKANLSGGRTRMVALKEAANDFVDILHQGASSRRDLAMGFIGYDVTVNVGHLLPSNAVKKVEGFNSFAGASAYGLSVPSHASGNYLAWKGCVMADTTVKDVDKNRLTSETGAWDLVRSLPGEGSHPPVEPFFVPPMYVPNAKSNSGADNPSSTYYGIYNTEPGNNLYRIDKSAFGEMGADYLARTELYRQYFYDYYVGLNNGDANKADDVVRRLDGSYYTPSAANRAGNDWYIDWKRIPKYYDGAVWKDPASATVNPLGGSVDSGSKNTTPMPSPNWQCPEEAMPPRYGRMKSEYLSHIANQHGAIYPANGTIHHAGLLWGYRLLVRDDVFTRANPTTERPRRALVFMTDGVNEIGESQNGYLDRTFTWYGRWSDSRIAANQSNSETQMLRRFEKTCANIQREANPPEIYIIALVANSSAIDTAFNNCAPGRVYRTSSTDELRRAFQDVAAELVDLHLIQ